MRSAAVEYCTMTILDTLEKPMTLTLKDQSLITHHAFINGVWVDADSGETLDVTNPATGEILSPVAKCGTAETRRMIEAAAVA